MPAPCKSQQPKLLDEVRRVLRIHHYSIYTKCSYVDWIVQLICFHHMFSREDLFPPEPMIEAFLTHLVLNKNVALTMQNQASCLGLPFSDLGDP